MGKARQGPSGLLVLPGPWQVTKHSQKSHRSVKTRACKVLAGIITHAFPTFILFPNIHFYLRDLCSE